MKKLLLLFVLCLCFPVVDKACTSIIITGKATLDGRPLMWKHRDTGAPYNHIGYFDEGGYRFLGLVNSDDPEGAVWTGRDVYKRQNTGISTTAYRATQIIDR